MDPIPEKVDSTFRFVLLAARRAEQLMRGARPRVDVGSPKPTRIALREVSDGLVNWDYGPPPAPPEAVEEVASEEESAGG